SPIGLLGEGVAWETLVFLVGVFLLGMAMQNVGVVARLARLYEGAGVFTIGSVAAVASAFMNNHPTAILNALALGGEQADKMSILAALVGGDRGPRLLPTGSLAGLMWLALLRVHGVPMTIGQFARVGIFVLVPSLLATLAVLRAF
ncbi:MAG: arsenical efflux pump membrane protein ArsB, partial [Deltaproteobacteria bacterium]|nr:arsenical efflux pump membrane protein ArsB [Deltaproteobacteria bacterium]